MGQQRNKIRKKNSSLGSLVFLIKLDSLNIYLFENLNPDNSKYRVTYCY